MKIKAVGLLSGGLDSTLAAKIMLEQGIEVHAINFTTPFCTCTPKKNGCSNITNAIKQLGNIPLKRIALGDEYLNMIKSPKHGYGRGMNPCIDCRILKIKKSLEYMKQIGGSFIFTGEVLGQRPMSQHRRAIELIDKKSVDEKIIVRPLSAKNLEPTIPEIRGWLNREKLLAITGRSRKKQISLAKEKKILEYPCPAGGCLLTDRVFSNRLKDYFTYAKIISSKDMPLLKLGRHFRLENGDKIIVARDEAECNQLENLNRPDDMLFVAENFSGPTALVLLQGNIVGRVFPGGNTGREAFPSGNTGEEAFPSGNTGEEAFPLGNTGREAFPSENTGREAFPSENTREVALNKIFQYTNAKLPKKALIKCVYLEEVEMISISK